MSKTRKNEEIIDLTTVDEDDSKRPRASGSSGSVGSLQSLRDILRGPPSDKLADVDRHIAKLRAEIQEQESKNYVARIPGSATDQMTDWGRAMRKHHQLLQSFEHARDSLSRDIWVDIQTYVDEHEENTRLLTTIDREIFKNMSISNRFWRRVGPLNEKKETLLQDAEVVNDMRIALGVYMGSTVIELESEAYRLQYMTPAAFYLYSLDNMIKKLEKSARRLDDKTRQLGGRPRNR